MVRIRVWLVALIAFLPVPAFGQAKPKIETKDVSFDSADGVELQGTLYKSVKGGVSPVVMILHSFGEDPNTGDWKGLATTLAENGYNVLRFDYRGHGKSTVIGNPKLFWSDRFNDKHMNELARKNPLPKKIEKKDVMAKPAYFPMVVNDIMAARVALDKMNDAGDVNTSSVYLIGATNAATLGMLYMAAEWSRPQVVAQAQNWSVLEGHLLPNNIDPAGKDIAGAIWLSAERHLSIPEIVMQKWIRLESTVELRDKNPMLFLYGATDKKPITGEASANFFLNRVLVANGDKNKRFDVLKFTRATPIADTANVGVKLLGDSKGTEETILKYLDSLEKDRKNVVRTPNRNWTKSPYVVLTGLFNAMKN